MSRKRTTSAAIAIAIAACAIFAAPALARTPPTRDLGGGEVLGAQIDPVSAAAFCDRLREDGSKAVSVFLSRGLIERHNGTLNTAAIDSRVETDRACGLEVAVRVKPTTSPEQDSFLPTGAELSEYTSLLTQLAQYLDGRVERYAIDNEAAAEAHFAGTAADYFELVRVSAAAISAGDPDAEILDGTMASGNMTAVIVSDLYGEGRYDEAMALAQETQANELGGGAPVTDRASLTAYVNSARVQRSVAFFQAAVANQSSYDAFQLHYYGPWRSLINMYDYVRSHGIMLPIETWEVAHRYRDGRPFVESEHADESARLLVTAAGEGSQFTIFTSYRGSEPNDDVGLYAFDATTPHDALHTYRTVVVELSGATSAMRLQLPGDAWGYRFERLGDDDVVAAWADPGPASIGSELGIDASTAALTTAGVDGAKHVRLSKLTVDGTPVFAEPDLVELERIGKRSRKRVKLRLSCPALSPRPRCAGKVKITRALSKKRGKSGAGKRQQALGKKSFRLRRGASKRLKIRFNQRGLPGQAIAKTKHCTVKGKGGCRSWTDLR